MTRSDAHRPFRILHAPELDDASLDELRRRAEKLRRAIEHEPSIADVVDIFLDEFVISKLFYELSKPREDELLGALLGPGGVLALRYPGERFHRTSSYIAELGLHHGAFLSENRLGNAFRFEGSSKGVFCCGRLGGDPESNHDFYRFSIDSTSRKTAPGAGRRSEGGAVH